MIQKGTVMETMRDASDVKIVLDVPHSILRGQTYVEQKYDLLQGAIIQAYLRDEISLMKAGELLGLDGHEEICKFFIELNIPTIKKFPENLEKTQDENRKYFEKKLGIQ